MQKLPFLATLLVATAALSAQNCIYVPDNVAGGSCNVIPFGDSSGSATWTNQKYQTLVPASYFGGNPYVIRELGFASCGTGTRAFSSLKITLDHFSGGTLSTTFASNLTANAVTVLDVKDYGWNNVGSTWNPIGLQKPFVYIPALGNLVIEIEGQGMKMIPSSAAAGMSRGGVHQRVYATSWTGTPPASGSTDSAATKVQICADLAWATGFGTGCQGSNNQIPLLSYPNAPKIGAANFSIDLAQAKSSGVSFLAFGATNAAPTFPVDLSVINMPGCKLYISVDVTIGIGTSSSGGWSFPLPIGTSTALLGVRVFNQSFVLDAGANGLGISASNAGWFLVGT